MVFAFATKPCSIGLSRTTRTQTTAMRVPWLFSFLFFASNVALQGEQRRHEIGEKSISESFPLGSGRVDATLGCGRHADHPQLGGQGLPVLFPCVASVFTGGGGSCCFVKRSRWPETPRTLGSGIISFPLFLPRFPLCRQPKHPLSLSHAAFPIDIDPSSHPPSTIGSFIFFSRPLPPLSILPSPLIPLPVNLPALVFWFFTLF
ncbi:hypothetical protein BKA57DRAFT_276185 [Linnemannia elongata]|nr:hypothetical protein BKA57DRAFT_276185 [Linnemannia elongata]